MSDQNQLTFLMVQIKGSDETVRQTVLSVANLIANQFNAAPASPSTPALPRSTEKPADQLPGPVHGKDHSPLAGGERAPAATMREPQPGRRRKRRTPSAPAPSAVPAQATFKMPRKFRKDALLFECSDKPGFPLTIKEAAEKTTWSEAGIRGRMAKTDASGWFEVDVYKLRRMRPGLSASPPPVPETKPRERSGIAPVNPLLVGRAASHVPQEINPPTE